MPTLRNVFLCLAAVPAIGLTQNSSSIDLLNFAMSDAQILAGANVTAAKNSPFGQFVLAQMQSGTEFQTFINETGFDPRTDLTEVLAASSGAPGSPSRWLIAAHGRFSVAISTVEGTLGKQGATITHVGSADVITLPSDVAQNSQGTGTCVAFFNDGMTAVMGECPSVTAAAQSGGAKSSVPAALAAKVQQLRSQDDAWFTSVVPLTQFLGGSPATAGPLAGAANSGLLKGIQQTSGGVKFAAANAQGPALQVTGEILMDTPQNAAALLNVVNFFASMLQANTSTIPGANPFASLFTNLQASVSGSTLNVNLSIPEATIEQMLAWGFHSGTSVAVHSFPAPPVQH